LAALVARALAGTSMPFVKTMATLMLLSVLTLKIRLKHVIVIACVTAVVYTGGLLIGYSRLGRTFDPETSSRLDPLLGESFNVNLSLMIATHNLEQKIYHPGLPVAIALYILPSWSVDKPALKDLLLQIVGGDHEQK